MAEEKNEGDIKKDVSPVKEPKTSGKSPKKRTMKMKVPEKDEKESKSEGKKTPPKKRMTKATTPKKEEGKKEKQVEKKPPPKKKKMKVETPAEEKKEEKEEEVEEEEELDEEEGEEEEEEIEIVEGKEEYRVKLKPELIEEMKASLKTRENMKRGIPKFRRQEWFRYKRLGTSWRKPRGKHSKARRHLGYRPNVVSIGYGGPTKAKHLHPSGFKEVMVYNVNDLKKLDPKKEAARIGHSVGVRKRIEIGEKAEELGIRVLNWRP